MAAALSAALFMGCAQTAEPVAETATMQTEADVAISIDIEEARVSFLGPEGTYTQEACEVFFGEYTYVIECEGLTYEEYCQIVSGSALEFRFLGSFNSTVS